MRAIAVLATLGVLALGGWGFYSTQKASEAVNAPVPALSVTVKGLAYTEPEKVERVQPEAPQLVEDAVAAPTQPAEAVALERDVEVAPETETSDEAPQPTSTEPLVCYQMGPMKESHLPQLNADLEKHHLVSKVFIEPVETPNDYRVCVGPFATSDDQEREVKLFQEKGLALAQSFTDEQGERYVSLRHFSTEWEAHDWALRAGQRLGLTRLAIKKATVDTTPTVRLLFHNLTPEEGKVVESLGDAINENVEVCR